MQYQVPTTKVQVVITIAQQGEMQGAVFISEDIYSYTMKPRLEDLLNQDKRFFSFLKDDEEFILFNKSELVILRSSENDAEQLVSELMLEPQEVELFLDNGESLSGVVYPNLPPDQRRVSDFFNQNETFLPIYCDDEKIIVNLDHVLYVKN